MRFQFKLNKLLLKTVTIHLGVMLLILVSLVVIFFQWVLPAITKHGQSITVPHLKGASIHDLEATLEARHLRYQLTKDVVYLPQYPPSVVLEQYPKPGAHVKEGRSIYITLNATQAPEVAMPNLVDGSVRHAHVTLKSRGLTYNTITYVVDMAQNAILEQHYQGQPIAPGTLIPQGSKIDLIVGAGLSKQAARVPDVQGMTLEEAELLLLDAGVRPGKVSYTTARRQQQGTVIGQYPSANNQVNLGSPVNLWIAEEQEEPASASESDQPIINQ
jgi:eukaryotic-like serine/threonine-protein kinase